MSSRGVVILTDPGSCGLGSADALVQAVLHVQQLNQAGLATTQAFCDHPAAAMKFIEAYAKAYPELHLQSSDLPPPESLYSIVADGRVLQLEAPAAPHGEVRAQPSEITPLYVLSLGAPDTLIQSLQHNRFITGDIQVVDIAPVERSTSERVSVADAVAHATLSSRRDQAAAEIDHGLEASSASEELSSSGMLASVGVDLEKVMRQGPGGQTLDDDGQAPDGPPTAIQPVTGAGDASGGPETDSHGARIGSTLTNHSISAMPDAEKMSRPLAGDGDSLNAAGASAPPDLRAMGPAVDEAESPTNSGPPPSTDAESHKTESNSIHELDESTASPDEDKSGADDEKPDDDGSPTSAAPDQMDAGAALGSSSEVPCPMRGDDAGECLEGAPDNAQKSHDLVTIADPIEAGPEGLEDGAAAGEGQPASDPELTLKDQLDAQIPVAAQDQGAEQGRAEGSSFSDPAEDIQYPPSGCFVTDDDDITYPLPPAVCDADPVGDLFVGAASGEIVDVAAVLGTASLLSESADISVATSPDLKLEFMGHVNAGTSSIYEIIVTSLEQIAAAPPESERVEPHHEDAYDQSTPVIHDLDI